MARRWRTTLIAALAASLVAGVVGCAPSRRADSQDTARRWQGARRWVTEPPTVSEHHTPEVRISGPWSQTTLRLPAGRIMTPWTLAAAGGGWVAGGSVAEAGGVPQPAVV